MIAEFQKQDIETLVEKVDNLIKGILRTIKDDGYGKQEIDVELLLANLEDFAGRDYIIWTKLGNDFPLCQEDKDYIKEILNKRAS